MADDERRIRLDKWLWAARFFKTRALAATAVNGGKVHLGGKRIKAARAVRLGERYEVQRGRERYEIVVTALSGRRGSATEAAALYLETEDSRARRQQDAERRRLADMQRPRSEHRPDKKQRRQIRRFSGKS